MLLHIIKCCAISVQYSTKSVKLSNFSILQRVKVFTRKSDKCFHVHYYKNDKNTTKNKERMISGSVFCKYTGLKINQVQNIIPGQFSKNEFFNAFYLFLFNEFYYF
jgi:hypothetical protein